MNIQISWTLGRGTWPQKYWAPPTSYQTESSYYTQDISRLQSLSATQHFQCPGRWGLIVPMFILKEVYSVGCCTCQGSYSCSSILPVVEFIFSILHANCFYYRKQLLVSTSSGWKFEIFFSHPLKEMIYYILIFPKSLVYKKLFINAYLNYF